MGLTDEEWKALARIKLRGVAPRTSRVHGPVLARLVELGLTTGSEPSDITAKGHNLLEFMAPTFRNVPPPGDAN